MQMLGINKLHVEKIDIYPCCYLTLIKSDTPQGSKVKKSPYIGMVCKCCQTLTSMFEGIPVVFCQSVCPSG